MAQPWGKMPPRSHAEPLRAPASSWDGDNGIHVNNMHESTSVVSDTWKMLNDVSRFVTSGSPGPGCQELSAPTPSSVALSK